MSQSNENSWMVQDKLAMYRGLIKLYNSERNNQVHDSIKLKKENMIKIDDLKKEIKRLRTKSAAPKNQSIFSLLQGNKQLYLALKNLSPNELKKELDEKIFTKRKYWDRIEYDVEKATKSLSIYQLKLNRLTDRESWTYFENDNKSQVTNNKILDIKEKKQTTKNIVPFYEKMKTYLQKDNNFYMSALSKVEESAELQQACVLRAIEMGQLATEEVCNMREEYKKREKDIRAHMDTQYETLLQLDLLFESIAELSKNLVRQESFTKLGLTFSDESIKEGPNISDLEIRVNELNDLLIKMKEAILVPEFSDIFPRMLEQLKQHDKLLEDFNSNDTQLGLLMTKIDHAHLILNSVIRQGQWDDTHFQTKKNKIAQELEVLAQDLYDIGKEQSAIGEVMIILRNALLRLLHVVSPLLDEAEGEDDQYVIRGVFDEAFHVVKTIKEHSSKLKADQRPTKKEDREDTMLLKINRKNRLKNLDGTQEKTQTVAPLITHELTDDPSVPNRAYLKVESKKIVELATSDPFEVNATTNAKKKKTY